MTSLIFFFNTLLHVFLLLLACVSLCSILEPLFLFPPPFESLLTCPPGKVVVFDSTLLFLELSVISTCLNSPLFIVKY